MNRLTPVLVVLAVALFTFVTQSSAVACDQLSFRSSLLYSAPLVERVTLPIHGYVDAAPVQARLIAYSTAAVTAVPACDACAQPLRQRVILRNVERVRHAVALPVVAVERVVARQPIRSAVRAGGNFLARLFAPRQRVVVERVRVLHRH